MTAALNEIYQELESEITERVSAEQANKSKTDFLARMSHEFRTPLNAILGFTELLMIELERKIDTEQYEQLEHVYTSGQHLLELVKELLDLGSIEAGKVSISIGAVEVNSVIIDSLHLVEADASRRDIKFEYNQESHKLLLAEADPSRLKQIFINLLSNAVKYNKTGGKVIIEIIAYEDMVKFSVRDEGNGLSRDQQDKVFSPFERVGNVDEAIEGTGIGLTIARHFVELMGGEMGINSTVGEGSEFWFTLPVYKETKHA
jgi:signal transduction histidine kinase